MTEHRTIEERIIKALRNLVDLATIREFAVPEKWEIAFTIAVKKAEEVLAEVKANG